MLLCHAPFCVAFFYPRESRYAFYLACWDNVFKPKGQCALGWVTNKQQETGSIRWRLIWDQNDSDRLQWYFASFEQSSLISSSELYLYIHTIDIYVYVNIYIHIYKQLSKYLDFCLSFSPKPDGRPPQSGSAWRFLPLQSFSSPQSLHICSGIRFYVMFVLNGVSGVRGTTWGAFAFFWGRGGQITWDHRPQTVPGSLSVVNCGCVVISRCHMSRQKKKWEIVLSL